MMKRERPKRVAIPNGRTSIERYQRVKCAHLPANTCAAWPYKGKATLKGRRRRRRQVVQQGRGIGSKFLKLAKKVRKAPTTWEIGKVALNKLPNLYK